MASRSASSNATRTSLRDVLLAPSRTDVDESRGSHTVLAERAEFTGGEQWVAHATADDAKALEMKAEAAKVELKSEQRVSVDIDNTNLSSHDAASPSTSVVSLGSAHRHPFPSVQA